MRRAIFVSGAALAFGVSACAHARPKPGPSAADYAATQQRAAQAQLELTRQSGGQAVSSNILAPETAPSSSTILGRDPSGCTWVESRATVVVGDQDSRAQARAEAISEARSFAMRDFLGVSVRSQDLVFQQENLRGDQNLVENILRTTQLGRILKEGVVSQGYQDAPDCPGCRYFVDLKTCLTPMPSYHDNDFRVTLKLSRTQLMDGDEDSITVDCTEDCYVYLYDVGMDDKAQTIAPNDLISQIKIPAGQEWTYPSADLTEQGVHLVAQLPPSQDVSAETIRVVATKTPLTSEQFDPSSGGYFGILQELNESQTDWAEDADVFTISKN